MFEACHTRVFPLQVNQCRLDPAVSGCLLALPVTKITIGVWDVTDSDSEPLSLIGHKRSISALSFSHDEPKLLCSAGEDFVIVWNVHKCLHSAAKGGDIRGEVILKLPGDVTHVSFSLDAAKVALCVDTIVKVINVASAKVEAELAGHAARVTAAQFCPHFSATMVTISDDRTVIVWDVENFLLVYQSSVLTAAPLISMCMNRSEPHVAVASAGGVIKVFDLADGKNFRQLCQLDVGRIISKHRLSQPQKTNFSPSNGPVVVTKEGASVKSDARSAQRGVDGNFSAIESSDSVLSLLYAYHIASKEQSRGGLSGLQTHSAVGEVLSSLSPVLVIIAQHCMLQIDSKTLQVLTVVDLLEPMPSTYKQHVRDLTLSNIGLGAVSQLSPSQLVVVVGAQFESKTHSILWGLVSSKCQSDPSLRSSMHNLSLSPSSPDDELSFAASDNELSMVANQPLTEKSPLKAGLVPSSPAGPKTTSSHRGSVGGGKPKTSDPMNQPLTFRSKVKSSGYTQAPRTTMFKPKTNVSKSKSADLSKPQAKGLSLATKMASQEYPIESGAPCELDSKFSTGAAPSSITDMKFSNSGLSLACALSNKTSLVFPSPLGQKESSVFAGHDGAINSVRWSNSGKYLLTASSDKTAVVWDRASSEVILTFNSLNNNFGEASGGGGGRDGKESSQKKEPYCKEVRGAQFFYMDKFVLVVVSNQLCLYKYHLDPTKDDIRRYLTKSHYKLVKSWETASQNFTTLSAPNAFYSYLAVCAGSNRNLEVYDLNAGHLAHSFKDAHAKPVHSIALNEGSTFTSQPQEALNVFATTSTLDCIKLWDMRSRRCVLRLQGHANQAHGCGIAFSACGTYLASGSEDKVAYVYDVRQGTFCQKLRGHTDVVSSVAFHPARPVLATGSIGGKVLTFKTI